MKKKLIACLLALSVLGSLALTGCKVAVSDEAAADAPAADDPASTGGEEAAEDDGSETAATGASIEKFGVTLENLDLDGTLNGQYAGQTLVVPVMSGDFEKAINDVVPIFEALSGATVEIESIPGEQLHDKVQLDLNNTHRYDVVLSPVAFLHSYAEAGKIDKLQPVIDEYASAGYDQSDFLPGLFETYGIYKGDLYAIPYKPDVELLFYRKDIFEDVDVQAAYEEKYGEALAVPTTNEEMLRVAEFFTKSLNPDSPVEYGYSTNMLKGTTRLLFINRGGDDVDDNLMPNMNNAEGLAALNTVLDLGQYAPAEWMEMGWDEANQFFADGNAAMMEQWPGLWNTVQADGSAVKDNIGVAVAPGNTPVLGGWGVGIAAESENKELAWKFVEFLTSKDGELMKIENTMDPCRASTYEIAGVQSYSPLYGALMESLNYAQTLADVDAPYISSQLNDVMELHIQDAMRGAKTPEQALADMEQDFLAALQDAGLVE